MPELGFDSHPSRFVRFEWRHKTYEGEYYPEYFSNDDKGEMGYVRPYSKQLRQWLVDKHQSYDEIDYDRFINVGRLIKCDALVTDLYILSRGDTCISSNVQFIKASEVTASDEEIAECRLDLLYRQIKLWHGLDPSQKSNQDIIPLEAEYKKLTTPFFVPLRYQRPFLVKLYQNGWTKLLLVVGLIYIASQLKN